MNWLLGISRGGTRSTQTRQRPAVWCRRTVAAACMALEAAGAAAQTTEVDPKSAANLSRLSIEELADIEISSVSKRPEPLADAPAAVYVINSEDIRRSGATSIPEALRLAPNLQVARVDSRQYAISARGFNGTSANKLLVMIDGRSVYTPINSGVFWDVQDVMLEDVERIEVVSGPGGTLWGANAVNGVINILTRSSKETQGTLLSLGAGNDERGAAARYGTRLNEDASLRVYAKGFGRDHTVNATGRAINNQWHRQQLGFRMDGGGAGDAWTLQGDAYKGSGHQSSNLDRKIDGVNLLGRWNRSLENGSGLQVQAYYDQARLDTGAGAYRDVLHTYDLDLQHRFQWGAGHDIVWGGGYRQQRDLATNSAVLLFVPAQRDLSLINVFMQGTMPLGERLKLSVGAKLERNNYTGLEFQPNLRLAWKPDERRLVWSAISRAVRTPSRLDTDLFARTAADQPFLFLGGPDFVSEKLTAYEIGYRAQPTHQASFSVSSFYNVYDDLRSIESTTATAPPFVFANGMEGHSWGVEMWGNYRVNDWWRLSAGYNYLKMRLRLKPGSRDFSGVRAAGNDPAHQLSLRSSMNLAHRLEFDAMLRAIGSLPNPNVASYVALDMRLGWTASKNLEISLSGYNLLDRRHPEFGAAPARSEIGRSLYLKMLWKL